MPVVNSAVPAPLIVPLKVDVTAEPAPSSSVSPDDTLHEPADVPTALKSRTLALPELSSTEPELLNTGFTVVVAVGPPVFSNVPRC